MVEELFDVVDEEDRVVATLPRSAVHARGLRHRAVSILLFGSDGRLLLQRRSLTKDECPGTLTASASGHVTSGDGYDETAPRELEEELGVTTALTRVGTIEASAATSFEFTVVYTGVCDGPFRPDPAEVSEVQWFTLEELRHKLAHEPHDLSAPFRETLRLLLDHAGAAGDASRISDALAARYPYFNRSLSFDCVVRGGTVITPSGPVRTDLGIRGGRIAEMGELSCARAASFLDARHLHVLPGAIDTQVHFREPGLEYKEDIGTGSASAVLGGITGFLEMPNTRPSTTTAELLAWKVARAEATSWAHFGFFVGATPENADQLGALEALRGAAGVKVFMGSSTGSLLVDDPAVLERVLRSGRRRVAVHAEDEARLQARRSLTTTGVHSHPEWRDATAAAEATARLLAMAEALGRPVHVLHVTTADEVPILARHRGIATFEVTPQHLTLAAPECYDRLGTLAQMNPPIRTAVHREALWRAVRAGLVDVIGSDHAPHTLDEKARPYPESPSGMPGVQTLLPLMLEHVHQGRLSLERLVDLVCTGPARIYGLRGKGRIGVGMDADLTIVDLGRRHTLSVAEMATRCGWTPFDGTVVHGMPVVTVLDGEPAMRDGALVGSPRGRVLQGA